MNKVFFNQLRMFNQFSRVGIWLICVVALVVMENCSCGGPSGPVNVNVGSATTSGSASVSLKELNKMVTGSDKKYVSVSFNGVLSGNASGTGSPTFNTQQTYEVTSGGVNPVPTVSRVNLQPGDWTVTVTVGSWSTSCTKSIAANATTSFTFIFNQNSCK